MTQQNSNLFLWAGVVLAILLGLAGLLLHGGSSSPSAGSTTQTNLASYVGNPPSAAYPGNGVESDKGFFDAAGGASQFLGSMGFGSNVLLTPFTFQGSNGSCVNAASSTLFAVKSPIGTSTAQIFITIGGNATTSSLQVGTSTTPNYSTASSIQAINSSNGIATNTVQTAYSGMNDVLPGMIAAGATTEKTIVVGPSQFVVGGSTSTATGAGAAAYSPNFSTCSYQIKWEN